MAALIVVTYHINLFGGTWFPGGYLAVDFFFMLSGFVLARAYQAKLDSGWPFATFMKVRLIRVYPLYAVAVAIYLLMSSLAAATHRPHPALGLLVTILSLNALFLPVPGNLVPDPPFPVDEPAWSLFMELVMNIIHALLLRRRSNSFLAVVLAVAGTVFAVSAAFTGTTGLGWRATEIFRLYGFSRVIFCYALGMLLFRYWGKRTWKVRLPPILLCGLLGCAMVLQGTGVWRVPYEFAVIALLFPFIILTAAGSHPGPRTVRLADFLGVTSYGIYILHVPLSQLLMVVWRRVLGRDIFGDAPWSGVIYLATLLLAVAVLDRFYDVPVRRFLGRKSRPAKA